MHLPLWLANTAHCLTSYTYSTDAVDQTLKIKQLTLSFLLPKCHSINLSGCSPKANLARAQGSRIKNGLHHADCGRAHFLPPQQTFPLEGDFQPTAESSHTLHSTRLSSLGTHPLPRDAIQSQALKRDSQRHSYPDRLTNMVLTVKFTSTWLIQKHVTLFKIHFFP